MNIQFADPVTVALVAALEGLLSAGSAVVPAALVLGLPALEQSKALRYGIAGAVALLWAELAGPRAAPAVAGQAEDLLAVENELIEKIDGDVTR